MWNTVIVLAALIVGFPEALLGQEEGSRCSTPGVTETTLSPSGAGERAVYDTPPSLINEELVLTALEGDAISRLRTESSFGALDLAVCIGEDGKVRWAEVTRSSDSPGLDEVALGVVEVMEFTPARNRDERMAVQLPFQFVLARDEIRIRWPFDELRVTEAKGTEGTGSGAVVGSTRPTDQRWRDILPLRLDGDGPDALPQPEGRDVDAVREAGRRSMEERPRKSLR